MLGKEYYVKLEASKEIINEANNVEIYLEINNIKMQIPSEVLNEFEFLCSGQVIFCD